MKEMLFLTGFKKMLGKESHKMLMSMNQNLRSKSLLVM